MSKEYATIETEKNYIQNILDSQNSIIIICQDKKIKFVNKRFYDYFEVTTNEDLTQALKKNFNSLKFDKWAGKTCSEKDDARLVFYKDSMKYIFLANVKKLDNTDNGEHIVTFTDITKLVESKETLRSVNSSLKDYKEALDTFTIVSKTNIYGIITYVNDRFTEISQYSKEELIGKNHNIVRHPEMLQQDFKTMWESISHKKIWEGVIKNRKKNGDTYFVNSVIFPILNSENKIIEYLALKIDITELIKSKKKAQKALKSKSMFLANMSHEIRTPLNGIIGFTNLLMKKDLEEETKEIVSTIDASTETLLRIINDILDISKIESEGISLKKSPIDLEKSFSDVTKLFQAKAKEKHIEYLVNISIKKSVIADGNRLKQVLSNLIGNAIKFTPYNGTVEITIDSKVVDKKMVVNFKVLDSGIGVPHEKQEKIFMPFSQADDDTDREFGGTGLGLSISAKIVEMMGGEIKIDSQKGSGSKFYFTLSFDISSIKSDSQKRNTAKSVNVEGKILIVEDHPVNQALIKAILKTKGNIEPTIAKNGKFAIDAFRKEKFDLILMDINMPVMDGVEAQKHMKNYEEQNSLEHTPIVALTANAMEGDERKFLNIGFDDYLAKPIQEKELDVILNSYLEEVAVNIETIVEKFLEEVDIDKDSFMEIVEIFFENIDIDMNELKKSIEIEDLKNIIYSSHKIASSSSAVRFDDIFYQAKLIEEDAMKYKNMDYKESYKKLKKSLLMYKKVFHP